MDHNPPFRSPSGPPARFPSHHPSTRPMYPPGPIPGYSPSPILPFDTFDSQRHWQHFESRWSTVPQPRRQNYELPMQPDSQTERCIFEDCDTNMLVEAWHHLLKSMFLLGKRNRRMDHLIHTLIDDVLPFFIRKQHVHESGFKGDDLQTKKRRAIVERALEFTSNDIEATTANLYHVASKSRSDVKYIVDMELATCNCLDYPLIRFCKHLCAVDTLLEDQKPNLPLPVAISLSAGGASLVTLPVSTPTSPSSASCSSSASPHSFPARPAMVSTPTPPPSPSPALASPYNDQRRLTRMRQQLHILSGRLDIKNDTDIVSVPAFAACEKTIDDLIACTAKRGTEVLPPKQHLPPNQSEWKQTLKLMPDAKNKSNGKGGQRKRKKRGSSGSENDPPESTSALPIPLKSGFAPPVGESISAEPVTSTGPRRSSRVQAAAPSQALSLGAEVAGCGRGGSELAVKGGRVDERVVVVGVGERLAHKNSRSIAYMTSNGLLHTMRDC
ncbi:hypothetical protein C8F01DRAFT_1369970 [Mycena amicta]|nr:hypothetical protein C8F01DRAFT_1369970 [Mycena amicta]